MPLLYEDIIKNRKHTGCLPSGNRKYHIKDMQDIHKEITRLIFLGMKNVDIAEKLNITPATVTNVRQSAIVQKELSLMQGAANNDTIDVARRIKELMTPAVDVLEDILSNTNKDASFPLKAKVAFGVLDRNGMSPVHKVANISGKLTKDDMEEIKAKARQFGPIIDITDEEEEEINKGVEV